MDMVDEEDPDIVFLAQNSAAPHECVRALMALKECGYSGVVQLFGRAEMVLLESLQTIGSHCSLRTLPPIRKPIMATTIYKIVLDQKLRVPSTTSDGFLLSDALVRNSVKFLYQPKFELKTNTMVGVEVVARVAHPQLGFLTPDRFLKGASEDDLLKLSQLVLINALQASAHFHEMGVAMVPAINISIENLLRLPISEMVLKHRPQRRDWAGLLLEVPERQVVNKIGQLKARYAELKRCEVSIAIDNFGRGPIYPGVLGQIPFSEIKIDRSIVQDCAVDPNKEKLCKSLIQTAQNFGIPTTAVGISTDADLGKIREFDCAIGQGFLLGNPMDAQEIDVLIAKYKSASA